MSKLDAEKRAKLFDKTFGEPGKRAYPMPDKSHAANAKARASQAVKAGRMSTADTRSTRRPIRLSKSTGKQDRPFTNIPIKQMTHQAA